jgi:hypothetical protein
MFQAFSFDTQKLTSAIAAAGAAIGFAGTASAADVFVVHAIPGQDLGQPEALPVDIAVDGECALPGVEYQDSTGPIPFETGAEEVEVFLADAEACDGALAISGEFDFAVGELAVIVAHLDQSGTPKLSKFTINGSELDEGLFRATIVHAAAAPVVNVKLTSQKKSSRNASTDALRNGDLAFPIELKEGTYKARINANQSGGKVVTLKDLDLAGNLVLIAAGSLANETFTVLVLDASPEPL